MERWVAGTVASVGLVGHPASVEEGGAECVVNKKVGKIICANLDTLREDEKR
jgi:hypothetical protein